jgi:hypothetical protein
MTSFTAQELANIANSALDYYMGKGEIWANAIQNKPMMKKFDQYAGTFSGGKGDVSLAVKAGQAGGSLQGYQGDDAVGYYNPATAKRVNFPWKEHHIGIGVTHSELKHDGITVNESGADQTTSNKAGRDIHVLVNMMSEKMADMNEDYAVSWDSLIHGDGSSDVKALAGIRSLILDDPSLGATGGLNRGTNSWWRNRAATAAALAASSGPGAVSSNVADGGALLQFLQAEERQLNRFARGRRMSCKFAGSDFIGALEKELRANGSYAQHGWQGGSTNGTVDGAMPVIQFGGITIEYDPTLDGLGLSKRMYDIDMRRVKLLYMQGEKMKKANPARPYDRYVIYRGVTTTAVMVAQQLNTSAVYDIA